MARGVVEGDQRSATRPFTGGPADDYPEDPTFKKRVGARGKEGKARWDR